MKTNLEEGGATVDQEWNIIQALARCSILSGATAARHQVSRLADFYGDSAKGKALRQMLDQKAGAPVRLVRSEGASPVARIVETGRYGPRGLENAHKSLRWLVSPEHLHDGMELFTATPASAQNDARPELDEPIAPSAEQQLPYTR
jgi:hypothetical protein